MRKNYWFEDLARWILDRAGHGKRKFFFMVLFMIIIALILTLIL